MPKYSPAEIVAAFRAEGIECEPHELGLAAYAHDPRQYARLMLEVGTSRRAPTAPTASSSKPPTARQYAAPRLPPAAGPGRWLTVEEAAHLGGVDVEQIRHSITAGELVAFHRVGNAVPRVRRADLLRWVRAAGPAGKEGCS